MTQIKAEIVGHSINDRKEEIISYILTYPRIIHAELLTHRLFSRNAASSRAIPFMKKLKSVMENPFIPIAWQKDHAGMQGTEYLNPNASYGFAEIASYLKAKLDKQADDVSYWKLIEPIIQGIYEGFYTPKEWWLKVRDMVCASAAILYGMGTSKQICNRLLEPFEWYTSMVTATEFDNFFELRCPQYEYVRQDGQVHLWNSKKDWLEMKSWCTDGTDNENTCPIATPQTDLEWLITNQGKAEIHLMALAEAMWDAKNESVPEYLKENEWHIPFKDKIQSHPNYFEAVWKYAKTPKVSPAVDFLVRVSTSMAARTSYTVVGNEKEFTFDNHIQLYDKMANQTPFHASPFEHCAKNMTEEEHFYYSHTMPKEYAKNTKQAGWCRNFRGYIQVRELLEANIF